MEATIPTTDSSDVFSISDQALSDRLHFVQEVSDQLPVRVKSALLSSIVDRFWKLGKRLVMSSQTLFFCKHKGTKACSETRS